MSPRPALTEMAHAAWAPYLQGPAWAIDATAGNGHDTVFLARTVGEQGRVVAVDIQQCALDTTRQQLEREGLERRVDLVRGDHARLRDLVGCQLRGTIRLICFNLGYLPTGDHAITTSAVSTLTALYEALLLLDPAGALSVIAYRGHPGGMEEAEAVGRFFAKLPPPWRCQHHVPTGTEERPGPVWWLASGG